MKNNHLNKKGIIATVLVLLTIILYAIWPSSILLGGTVVLPNGVGLRVVTNSGTGKQLSVDRYEDASVREILNESNSRHTVWVFYSVDGNKPSDYRVLEDGNPIDHWVIPGYVIVMYLMVLHPIEFIKHANSAGLPHGRPQLFAKLKPLSSNQRRRIEIRYEAEGHLVFN